VSFVASRTTRVLALTALLAVAAVTGTLLARPPSLTEALHVPWWVFIGLFYVTEAFVMKLRVRGQLEGISLSEIPLVIGLFTTEPGHVVISRMIAGLLVFLTVQKHTPVKAIFNVALIGSSTATTIAIFGVLVGDHQALGPVGWVSVPLAVTVSGLFEGAVIVLVIGWYAGSRPVAEVIRELAFSVIVPVAISAVGLATVYALDSGAAVLPLAMTGAAAMMGYRAFAALSDRHASLERLYVLSDALAVDPGSGNVIAAVLAQSATLMRADYSEITLTGVRPGDRSGRRRPGPAAGLSSRRGARRDRRRPGGAGLPRRPGAGRGPHRAAPGGRRGGRALAGR
jgi:hypothetical protein